MSGIPLYDVIEFFFKGINKSSLISRANAVSYSLLLAIFPAILFFFTLTPYFPIPNLQSTVLDALSQALPPDAFNTVKSTIIDIVSQNNNGFLSMGFALSLFFSTNGMMGLIKAFNRTGHTIETRSDMKVRLISFVLVVIVSFIIIISAGLLISTNILLKHLSENGYIERGSTQVLISIGKWLITLIMIFIAISTIYYLAPAKRNKSSYFSLGSIFATLLAFLFMLGFSVYIESFTQYNKLYGSLGTIIVLMLWVNFNMISLLIGFELNASILDAKNNNRSTLKAENSDAGLPTED
jgi:membrane protein